jgi:hypothetical protein
MQLSFNALLNEAASLRDQGDEIGFKEMLDSIDAAIELRGKGRRGDWIFTASGEPFWPLDARPSEIRVEDVAHQLSNITRYAGAPSFFYSVGQHATQVSFAVENLALERGLSPNYAALLAFAGLHHDDTEAYLIDLPKPLKNHLPEYVQHEMRLAAVVEKAFQLPEGILEHGLVKEVDKRITADERMVFFRSWQMVTGHRKPSPLGVDIVQMTHDEARCMYLDRHASLSSRLAEINACSFAEIQA